MVSEIYDLAAGKTVELRTVGYWTARLSRAVRCAPSITGADQSCPPGETKIVSRGDINDRRRKTTAKS